MNIMFERVANAIYQEMSATTDPRSIAHAAISAMLEPTELMLDAVYDAELDIYWHYRADGVPGGAEDAWRVMIDACICDVRP